MNVIDTKHLNKKYGKFTVLKEINFVIKRGEIVGLIGPNGAGKTILLKFILRLTSYSGELNVLGLNPRSDRVKLMHHLCFIPDVAILPRWIKVENLIEFVEGVHPNFN